MKLDDTPRATSKNIDVLKEFEAMEKKNEANFVVIGMYRYNDSYFVKSNNYKGMWMLVNPH